MKVFRRTEWVEKTYYYELTYQEIFDEIGDYFSNDLIRSDNLEPFVLKDFLTYEALENYLDNYYEFTDEFEAFNIKLVSKKFTSWEGNLSIFLQDSINEMLWEAECIDVDYGDILQTEDEPIER